jgi:hypothetical protein
MSGENVRSQSGRGAALFPDPDKVHALVRESGIFDHRFLRRWTVSAEGKFRWTTHTASGEIQASALRGVIIDDFDRRRYWPERYGKKDDKRRPECSSPDGIVGIGSPGGRCQDCPLSHFGASKNEQPACRHYQDLLVWRPGMYLPEYVIVPPASLAAHQRFRTRLGIAGIPIHGLLMSFGLASAKNSSGATYPEVIFDPIRKLTPPELTTANRYVAMFAALIQSNGRIPRLQSGIQLRRLRTRT